MTSLIIHIRLLTKLFKGNQKYLDSKKIACFFLLIFHYKYLKRLKIYDFQLK